MSGTSDAGPGKVMFLDESGDHSLTVIDPQYPIFVLGGIIADRAYAEREITAAVRQFKTDLFGRADICLHTSDIVRNRNGKRDLVAGLELADLVVSPIGRHVLGRPTKEDFRIVESKFRRNRSGDYRGFGLVVLPKE